ncbi:MAG: CPBP family intramembrane glutamic endopeptidase, partial [Catalinimonas sp.]
YFFFPGVPYWAVCALVAWRTNHRDFWRQPAFWWTSGFGFVLLAVDRGNALTQSGAQWVAGSPATFLYWFKLIDKLLPLLCVVLPLVLFYVRYQRRYLDHFYGLRTRGVDLRPYLVLLALMVPLIAAASFQPDFLREYPNYRRAGGAAFAAHRGVGEGWVAALYELAYGSSFLSVELFFRGFLIFGLTRFLGREVVLPMACTYCVLHFGKPLGEAVSSFFGGYLLGVISLRTGNIWGGVMIHLGIAWLMEAFAGLQVWLR